MAVETRNQLDLINVNRVADFGYRKAPVVVVGRDHYRCGFRPDLIAQLPVEATCLGAQPVRSP